MPLHLSNMIGQEQSQYFLFMQRVQLRNVTHTLRFNITEAVNFNFLSSYTSIHSSWIFKGHDFQRQKDKNGELDWNKKKNVERQI